ncbi:MAG: NADH-quinone oxidoreductase subunit L [Nibricoccus sp.]
MAPLQLALLVLLLPLASAAIIALFLRRQGTLASSISVGACAALAVAALKLVFGDHRFASSVSWMELGGWTLSLGFKFDDLAALMLAIVAIVGLCVHVFSLGYMHEDGAKARYFGGLSVFMFSMLGIVFADNLFMMFIFWELVGFSSWLLINHFHEKQSAADASKKAFIVNRVGDFGFLIGIIWCYAALGTVNLSEIAIKLPIGSVITPAIPILLFCGAVGKSAQMPLHVWLPDAMEGPTPVSALIHAATMVAAGIYMLCRIEPLFAAAPAALNVVMWIGVATAVYAALCAVTQSDIKKVLAYSTLSQLGYMVAAFGLGRLHEVQETDQGKVNVLLLAGAGAAMFHLMTHAFFKALLFLGSGSVIHGCHHEQNIFKMGGLAKKMKLTFATFTIGVLAIIGTPLLSGFFSKDTILLLAFEKNRLVFGLLAFTAVLTSFYMVRLWKLVFLGKPRGESAEHAHESGFSMIIPLVILALLAITAGWPEVLDLRCFRTIFDEVPNGHNHEHAHHVVFTISLIVVFVGALSAYLFYKPEGKDTLAAKSPGLFSGLALLKASPDEIFNYYVKKVQDRFALVINFIDNVVLARLIVGGLAGFVGLISLGARALYVGSLHAYVYWFLIGAALVWGFAAGIF